MAKRQATSHFVWTTKKVREESERDSEFQSRETDSSEDEAGSEKELDLHLQTVQQNAVLVLKSLKKHGFGSTNT